MTTWLVRRACVFATFAWICSAAYSAMPPREGDSIEGILTVLYGDPHPSSGLPGRRLQILNTDDGRRFELDLSGAPASARALPGMAGKRVRVTAGAGAFDGARLRVLDLRALDQVSPLSLAKISGSQPFISILCKFAGNTAEPRTPAYFLTQLGTASPGFNHYFREVSYGTLNLDGSTTSPTWIVMPQSRSFYLESGKDSSVYLDQMFKDCTNAAASVVDFSRFYGINLMFNDRLDNAAWGGGNFHTLSGVTKAWPSTWMPYSGESNDFGWRNHGILAHEMSHAFGAPHSESPDGDEYGSSWDVVSNPGATCAVTDPNYGCLGQHENAQAKTIMEILPASRQAVAGPGSQTYTIERLALPPTSTSIVMLRINIAGSTTRSYTVEARQRSGYDVQLPGDGVIINSVDTTRDRPARLVVPGGGTGPGLGGIQAIWPPGSTFVSVADNVSIRVNSFSAAGTASVTVGPVPTGGSLGLSPNVLAFGGQSLQTTSLPSTVTVSNLGSGAMTVTAVAATGPFSLTHNCTTLAAGATCKVTVTFKPTAEGAASGTMTVTTSSGAGTVALSGTGEKSLVTYFFQTILQRAPDAATKAFWESEAQRMAALGVNLNETWYSMAQSFYGGADYAALNRSDADFVRDLFNTFYNRPADAASLASWTSQIASGMPREIVLASFMFSPEFTTFTQSIFGNTAARAEVNVIVDFYRGLLSRLPDSGGFAYWVGLFRVAQCQGADAVYAQVEAISSAYINSSEYLGRNRTNPQYVGDLYNSFLRRGGDLGGALFWIGQLNSSVRTRETMRRDFLGSPEFNARVNAIIAQGCLQ